MAYSPSPTSPLAGVGRPLPYAHRSPTPPAQPLSKKEKRYTQHSTLSQGFVDDINNNREYHYRRQLIALQHDMNLIIHADPYNPEPLDDSPGGIEALTKQAAANTPYQHDLSMLAGKWYSEFVHEVNDAKEAKELELIRIGNNHEAALERLKFECDFKCHLTAQEYDYMNNTLRERLVTRLSAARQRLMKEKEQLDIADTNALLLHPNQFTITNPTSPGGHASRKTTRLTRHRGDQDELNSGYHEVTNKRKRKLMDDDVGSPSRNGASTPVGRGKADALAQQTAPLYSIHSLFTEKELNFQSHQAQIAARHFFSTSQKEGESDGGKRRRKDNDEDKSAESAEESAAEEEEDLEAPEMERNASQNVHVTRSTRAIGGLSGLNILSDLAEKASTRPALPYATLHTHQPKAGTYLPAPSRLLEAEIEEDALKLLEIDQQPAGALDKKACEEALAPISKARSKLAPDWPVYLDMHLVEIDPRTAARKEG